MPRLSSLIRRRVGALNLHWVYPPHDYVSNVAVHALDHYIDTRPDQVRNICVVGVHNGDEVPPFLRRYPNARVHLYEPSQRYLPRIRRRFGRNSRVTLREVAASDQAGRATFYETNRHGSGSLLEVGPVGREAFGLAGEESHEIECMRLDEDFSADSCDCLWIDVQGAEMMVLRGAEKLLPRTAAIHIEVSAEAGIYIGDSDMDEITAYLKPFGFRLMLLGMDRVQGNAVYIRRARTT